MSAFDLRHALAVAGRVSGSDAKLTAILHDALEDGACELDDLFDADLPEAVTAAVWTLTRRDEESYGDYVLRVRDSGNELARAVKLADLATNLARLDAAHASLEPRYRAAVEVLSETKEVST